MTKRDRHVVYLLLAGVAAAGLCSGVGCLGMGDPDVPSERGRLILTVPHINAPEGAPEDQKILFDALDAVLGSVSIALAGACGILVRRNSKLKRQPPEKEPPA